MMPQPEQPVMARVATSVPCTEAEGPGRRFALWFQGCPLRCPGCCNPEYLAFAGGTEYHVDDLISAMRQSQHDHQIEGMTLLGGEPFAHAVAGAMLAEAAHACGLSVMIFSGYWLEDLQSKPDPATQQLLQHCDLLVDGPYVRELPDTTRRWIGSQNQRIHFLTDRYRADDPCWAQRNTLEIRVKNNEVLVNGFPAAQAKALWRGWKRTAREVPS